MENCVFLYFSTIIWFFHDFQNTKGGLARESKTMHNEYPIGHTPRRLRPPKPPNKIRRDHTYGKFASNKRIYSPYKRGYLDPSRLLGEGLKIHQYLGSEQRLDRIHRRASHPSGGTPNPQASDRPSRGADTASLSRAQPHLHRT